MTPQNMFEINISVDVEPAFLQRIWTYTAAVDTEVSGLFEIEWNEEKTRIVVPDKLHMFKQRGSGGGTHLNMTDVSDWVLELAENGETTGKTHGWYHTHVGMPVFFSQTDEDTIDELSSFLGDQFVAVVTNNLGESRWRGLVAGKTVEWTAPLSHTRPSERELKDAKIMLEGLIKQDPSFGKFFRRSKWSTKRDWSDFYRRDF